ncbi:MAG TPA: hypothetical protein VES20_22610 [Bryobacteraceae bacterium]|nr:hypothetical protein [Bryobacteraceae bacterium]
MYGRGVAEKLASLDVQQVRTAPASPPQNCRVEPLIGMFSANASVMIGFNRRYLNRILTSYLANHASFRTHLSAAKDCGG